MDVKCFVKRRQYLPAGHGHEIPKGTSFKNVKRADRKKHPKGVRKSDPGKEPWELSETNNAGDNDSSPDMDGDTAARQRTGAFITAGAPRNGRDGGRRGLPASWVSDAHRPHRAALPLEAALFFSDWEVRREAERITLTNPAFSATTAHLSQMRLSWSDDESGKAGVKLLTPAGSSGVFLDMDSLDGCELTRQRLGISPRFPNHQEIRLQRDTEKQPWHTSWPGWWKHSPSSLITWTPAGSCQRMPRALI